jgi:hypothetical protein
MSTAILDDIRLVPGEGRHVFVEMNPGSSAGLAFIVRPFQPLTLPAPQEQMLQKAGMIKFNDVFLVLTMLRTQESHDEIFDLWWNYHSTTGHREFEALSQQERLPVYFCLQGGKKQLIEIDNRFRKFFGHLTPVMERTTPWTEVAFERSLRGFCAQAYPLEHLWESIDLKEQIEEAREKEKGGLENYSGMIPEDLRDYYIYAPEHGHCITIIPSIMEESARSGNPNDYLHAAPVKTVLRCGIRWVKGYPVAPIPFIPGHGLAVPPDDVEL